ncbi:MAG: QacE [Nevskiaceae bacterium]|nr:MAG: QacE [Nevskiaceae bacterium]
MADTEKTFLSEGGVTVTNTRFIVPSQTYAMSGITSVKSFEETPSRKGPIILIAIGLLAMLGGKDSIVVALLFLAGGIAWWVLKKAKYHVLLSSASGEAKALSSPDQAWIGRVVGALNDAIVHRG